MNIDPFQSDKRMKRKYNSCSEVDGMYTAAECKGFKTGEWVVMFLIAAMLLLDVNHFSLQTFL